MALHHYILHTGRGSGQLTTDDAGVILEIDRSIATYGKLRFWELKAECIKRQWSLTEVVKGEPVQIVGNRSYESEKSKKKQLKATFYATVDGSDDPWRVPQASPSRPNGDDF